MNRLIPRRTAWSASCMVARQLISQVSFGSRSPHGSFATDDRWMIASTPSRSISSMSRTSPLTTFSLGCG